MSYETNPILNRLKLSKGWKTSSFPTKSLNYSRDLRVWFKLYLFLKVYFLLYGMRLLTYEVRHSDKYTKSLYLSLTKLPKKKKLSSKWKGKSFLKGLKSPLSVINNKKGRFLLYLDLKRLKKKIFSFLNHTNKILLSRAWVAKPKKNSWINTTLLIGQQRQWAKLKYQSTWKKKHLLGRKIYRRRQKIFAYHNSNATKNFFWKKKERNLFSLLTKIQKEVDLFEKYLRLIWNQNLLLPDITLSKTIPHLHQQWRKKKLFLKKVSKIYVFLQKKNLDFITKRVKNTCSQRFVSQLKKKKIKLMLFHFWLNFAQQLKFSQKNSFFLSPNNQRFLVTHKKTLLSWNKALFFPKRLLLLQRRLWIKKNLKSPLARYSFCNKNKKRISLKIFRKSSLATITSTIKVTRKPKKNFTKKNSFSTKKNSENYARKIIRKKEQEYLTSLHEMSKTMILQKPLKIGLKNIFLWIRVAQKKKKKRAKKVYSNQKTKVFLKQKTKKKQIAYRFSLRQNYRKFLTIATHVKLKYILQDLIKNYFALTVFVKVSWPLIQFKNLNFFRFVFPKYKMQAQNNKVFSLKISKLPHSTQKKYIYVGQTTKHLRFKPQATTSNKNNNDYPWQKKQKTGANGTLTINSVGTKTLNILNLHKDKMKKKNKYLALKTKRMTTKSEKRLALVANTAFISALLTTLTLFVKYLDPQPLADHLATLIGKTKKHAELLKLVESILRTFSLKRGLGYRIALIGRINGANKSKTLYLRKLNRNWSRQTFSKKVNFALAHARALIGTFAVKVWIYA